MNLSFLKLHRHHSRLRKRNLAPRHLPPQLSLHQLRRRRKTGPYRDLQKWYRPLDKVDCLHLNLQNASPALPL